ncbi:M48 family metallopeptidase [Erythrobacter sp. BLCC-B19]|uniref:M48 family metallopeptidase n=1 Tax=Erythrobacter sp. BLCC-B19 TaxID=3025315 RepID=UPI00235F6890|nr:M48 family metallopeptidase [Erythrobacter sp. BLCC-B19]WDA42008.1 M48 family metallopeptidase [Erythrobacter sp. BLCC-B19]
MRKAIRLLAAAVPVFAVAGLAGGALLAPAHSQSLNDIMGAGQKVIQAATVSDAEIVAYFGQMSDEMDKQNPLAPAKNPYAVRLANLTKGLDAYDGLTLDIKAYLVDEVNAFAMGDGTVRVYSGLMDKMTDDEVRCVIGHEIGHVKLEHGAKRMKRALQQDAALSVAGTASSGVRNFTNSQLGALLQNVVYAQYSQAAETQADDYALTFMKARGYPQAACATAMDKLAALGSGGGIGLLKTHPDPAKRAKRMRKLIK